MSRFSILLGLGAAFLLGLRVGLAFGHRQAMRSKPKSAAEHWPHRPNLPP